MAERQHEKTVIQLTPDGINPPTKVTLCSCGDRRCTKWKVERRPGR